MIAALITAGSAWHIRASQMNSASDGGMFTFFFFVTIYLFMQYMEKKQTNWLVWTGISFGLTMLSKETGFLLMPILGVYYILQTRKGIIQTFVPIIGIGALIFSIYPVLDIVYNHGDSIQAIATRVETAVIEEENNVSWFLLAFSIFKIVVWMGPILLFLPILWFFNKEETWKQKMSNVFFITIIMITLFYFIVTPSNLDRTRYFMVLIPALALLSAKYITTGVKKADIKTREWSYVALLSVIFFFIFISLNAKVVPVSYESNENPLYQIRNVNINFSLPMFTETDNAGFALNFSVVFISLITTSLLFICLLVIKDKTMGKVGLIIFLSISIGYNGIIAEEYALHWTSPNYSDAIKKLTIYAQTHELEEPIYLLKNYELQYYLKHDYRKFVSMYGISETDKEKITRFQELLQKEHGTIIFTDMPFIDKEGMLWNMITTTCKEEFVVEDKGMKIGYVFGCDNSS